ncbi:MAG: CRTAC1 family protein, partial [Acidobacteriota bacterium]|nr:CRTAC1 family protein [Acidobacteriota bacterium]
VERGSRRAVEAFLNELSLRPDALDARWLLNLALMTLGEYPDAVPERWLIPPEVFASDHDIGRFRDVAPAAGLAEVGLAGGSVVEDLDGDGLLDIVTTSWGVRDPMRYYVNNGDGTFTDRTAEAGLTGLTGGLNVNHADYDNDGDADVMVFRGGWLGELGTIPNSLLRNNGDGTFDDVTEEAGLLELHPTHSGAWGDFNNDGWLDLFVGSEQRSATHPHPSHLYVNNGDGTFDEIAAAVGLADQGFVKGVVWGDYDNDGRLDLYVSTFGSPNRLYRNEGPGGSTDPRDWRFSDVTAAAGVGEPIFGFPTWFFDYDNDGFEDIFVASWDPVAIDVVAARYLGLPHVTEGPRLYRNNGDGTFDDVTEGVRLRDAVLLAMSANFGDLDNDGWPDLYVGTGAPGLETLMPNKMFRNANGEWFQDVTSSGGFGHLQKGHGISFGDIDNDGDQDVFAVMGGWFSGDVYQNVLFENPGHGRHFLVLQLEGTRSNRAAVGARLRVRVGAPGGTREIRATVGTGGSFGSSTLRQEIGLGGATAIELVEVTWPRGGEVQVFRDLAVDGSYRLREGETAAIPLRRPTFAFPETEHGGQGHR